MNEKIAEILNHIKGLKQRVEVGVITTTNKTDHHLITQFIYLEKLVQEIYNPK